MGLSFAILRPHADSNNNFASMTIYNYLFMHISLTPDNILLHYPAQAGGSSQWYYMHAGWVLHPFHFVL